MDFKQIEAFINVAKFKSFSKAANSTFLSQPAISSHIASLEKELNVQLFDRTSKEVILTPAGDSFLKYALDILNTRDKAIYNLTNFNGNVNGRLKLAASTTPCNTIVPQLIKKFHSIYPEVSFDVIEQSSGKIIQDIVKFDCEIGIVGELVSDERIKNYKLIEDDLILISPLELNLSHFVKLESILKFPFILREQGSATRKTFENALQKTKFNIGDINLHFEVNNLDTQLQFVKHGLGISVVSKQVFRDYISSGMIKESIIEDLSLKRSIYMVLSSKRTLTPTSKAFFDLCKEDFKF
ncbi:selenium metabolism-associated LysR family transcriptional regulator [Clostridium sp. JN-1]|uniref:selenium metabolism-associated LysR family transcriptional regulator n=1 Tax=Clostridium sp. JN-1 TaxID=2483110 RepID=UPI000F0B4B15|nr:selenium metabolism-associated LysR family transcriptional regulator [Clostridium sp. JN-1]